MRLNVASFANLFEFCGESGYILLLVDERTYFNEGLEIKTGFV